MPSIIVGTPGWGATCAIAVPAARIVTHAVAIMGRDCMTLSLLSPDLSRAIPQGLLAERPGVSHPQASAEQKIVRRQAAGSLSGTAIVAAAQASVAGEAGAGIFRFQKIKIGVK